MAADAPAGRPILGLLVNPIAGLGGRVGLKGTDGGEIVARALALGAVPAAASRAATALSEMARAWPAGRPGPRLAVGPGSMGEHSAASAGLSAEVVGPRQIDRDGITAARGGRAPEAEDAGDREAGLSTTTAEDTRRLARHLAGLPVDLLLVAGGDGTARDVASAVDGSIPVLGVPAGVKMHSAVFAAGPAAAGRLAAAFLASGARRTEEREVLDLDEEAYRRGEVAPRLHGFLRVPAGRAVQGRKSPAAVDDAVAAAAIAEAVVGAMVAGRRYVLGPGTTVRAVAERLGIVKTLVGIDVVELSPDGPRLVVADAGERELLEAVGDGPATILVTPIGGQGFLLGRGNQPLSPAVLRAAGPGALAVVATPAKLAALGGRPLLVDTGDPDLDAALAGHVRVLTGAREWAVARVAPA